MPQDAPLPLDGTFRPRIDHGLILPEGTEVLSAGFGSNRANVWLEAAPCPVWGRRAEGAAPEVIGQVPHPIWRIHSVYGTIAATEVIAKYIAEALARDAAGMPPGPMDNPATLAQIFADRRLLEENATAARSIHQAWKDEIGKPEPEMA